MRSRVVAAVVGGIVGAMFAALTAGATSVASSGDVCLASGSGTTYTLHLTIAPSSAQYGFAVDVPGARVTSLVIPGTNGSFTTQNLAPSTSGAWVSDTPLTGSPVVTLTTNAAAAGALSIVPFGASQSSSFGTVRCAMSTAARAAAVSFSVSPHLTYSGGGWRMVVSIPGPGTVSAVELEATTGTAGSKPSTAQSLVQARRVVAKSGGTVTLTLRPTPPGQQKLKLGGSLKVKLHVVFDATSGKTASKLLGLTLKS